ncbi:MAG: hypothetical protein ACQEWV_06650 [Bacillota bacterium]
MNVLKVFDVFTVAIITAKIKEVDVGLVQVIENHPLSTKDYVVEYELRYPKELEDKVKNILVMIDSNERIATEDTINFLHRFRYVDNLRRHKVRLFHKFKKIKNND